MGKVVMGLMYGNKIQHKFGQLIEGMDLEELCQDFHFEDPQWSEDGKVLGYLVFADVEETDALPINVGELDAHEDVIAAKAAWEAFDAFACGKGAALDAGQFYLVRQSLYVEEEPRKAYVLDML